MKPLVSESFYCALLESGCKQTVCQETWYNSYKEYLTKDEVSLVKESPSSTKLKFGNGDCVDLLKKVITPTKLGGRRVNINTNVISKDIPLLLCKFKFHQWQTLALWN